MENKKKVLIGRTTFGISLILFGITLSIQTFLPLNFLRYILMLWPLIIVFLGIEIIYYSHKENIETKYDFLGTVLTGMIVFVGIGFGILNYGVNKVLYNDDFMTYINSENQEDYVNYYFDSTVDLINMTDRKIDLSIMTNSNIDETQVVVKYILKEVEYSNIFEYFSNDEYIQRHISYENYYEDYNNLTILSLPDVYESVSITILTNNLENIKTTGLFNLISK